LILLPRQSRSLPFSPPLSRFRSAHAASPPRAMPLVLADCCLVMGRNALRLDTSACPLALSTTKNSRSPGKDEWMSPRSVQVRRDTLHGSDGKGYCKSPARPRFGPTARRGSRRGKREEAHREPLSHSSQRKAGMGHPALVAGAAETSKARAFGAGFVELLTGSRRGRRCRRVAGSRTLPCRFLRGAWRALLRASGASRPAHARNRGAR
jgi:hypothetical protein